MAEVTNRVRACEGCGAASSRLDDEGQCLICRFKYLVAEEQGIMRGLEVIADVVHAAVVSGYVHPDDAREEVDRVLSRPGVAEWTPKRVRFNTAHDDVETQADLLRAEVAS
jgi:hypothetical protein